MHVPWIDEKLNCVAATKCGHAKLILDSDLILRKLFLQCANVGNVGLLVAWGSVARKATGELQ